MASAGLLCGCTASGHRQQSSALRPQATSPSDAPRSVTPSSAYATPAFPPCEPPPFGGPTLSGRVIGLGVNTPHSALLDFQPLRMRIGEQVVLDLGIGCNSAGSFTTSGAAVAITGRDAAPLPDTGDNDVQLTAVAVGSSTVHITVNRACSAQGVTKGRCFGTARALPDVAVTVTA
jgi:hypothetical protein